MNLAKLLMVCVLAAGAARAEELRPLSSRPLTLPPGSIEVTVQLTQTEADCYYCNSSPGWPGLTPGLSAGFGLDVGVTSRLQVGVAGQAGFAAGQDETRVGLGSFFANGTYGLTGVAALRLDAGIESVGFLDGPDGQGRLLSFGIGVPARFPLGGRLAFVSGRTGALAFGTAVMQRYRDTEERTGPYFGGTAGGGSRGALSSDLFVLQIRNRGSETLRSAVVNVPLGLEVELADFAALTVRTGMSFSLASGNTDSGSFFVPVGLDLVVMLGSNVDVGAFVSTEVGPVTKGDTAAVPLAARVFLKLRL